MTEILEIVAYARGVIPQNLIAHINKFETPEDDETSPPDKRIRSTKRE